MYKLDPKNPHTMPTVSVFRDPRPWENGGMRYGRNTALSLTFLTSAEGAARLLPEPFRLEDEALVSVSIVQCEDVDWLAGRAYNLIGVDVAAVFDGEVDKDVRGAFCVVMWENMTEPILGGRDHSGVPKVYCDIPNLMRHDDTCRGSASHFGFPILDMSARDLKPLSQPQRTDLEQAKHDSNWMNLKYFPNVQNTGPDISYASTYPASAKCPAAWDGKGEIRFHESTFEKNPTQYVLINLLEKLPVLEVRMTRLIVWEPFMALDREPRTLRCKKMPRTNPEDVQHIAILGTGTIGCGWATYYLAHGKTLTVYDPAPDAEARLSAFVKNAWPTMKQLGLSSNADPKAFRVVPDAAAAVMDAQFVQENAPENVEAKVGLYEQIDDALGSDTVVASSTSGLFMSELQKGRVGPNRYVVGHPFNPHHIVPLVEVVGGDQTDAEVIDWTLAFYRAHGKQAIHIRKEVAGHLANRLQVALLREAVHAVAEGIATVEDVDAAVVHALGLRWALIGPYLTIHLAGGPGGMRHHFEHLGPSIKDWWNDLGAPHLNPQLNEKLIEGIEDETAGRSFEDLVSERDNLLVEVIKTLKKARGES